MAVPNRPVGGASIESAWGGVVHDTAVAQDIQSASVAIASAATLYVDYTWTFPRPFAAVPNVQATLVLGTTQFLASLSSVSATAAVARLFRRDGANMAAGTTATVHLLAIGPRA